MAFDPKMLAIDDWFYYRSFYDWCAVQLEHLWVTNGRPVQIAEVGCWKGHSTAYLMQVLAQRNVPFVLMAVDLWHPDYFVGHSQLPPELRAGLGEDALFAMFMANTAFVTTWDTKKGDLLVVREDSALAARHVEDQSVDMVFIDADHTYDAVVRDINAWLPKVRPGGILAGHDYWVRDPGVVKAVNEAFRYVALFDGLVWQAMGLVRH